LQEDIALAARRSSAPRWASGWGTEAIVCLWAWLVMAGCVVGLTMHAASGHIARTDLRLLSAAHRLPASIEPWFNFEAGLGSPGVVSVCVVSLALLLFMRRAWLEGAVTLSAFGMFAAVVVLKHLVAEVPPYKEVHAEYAGIFESNYSFPSGHVVAISVLFGLVFVFADRLVRDKGLAFLLRLVAFVFIASVGPGRIWLGVHYPSDVVAAYLLAAMFLLPVWFCSRLWRRTMRRQHGT
jgi:membrane-associated phospholipid phosphatase